MLFGRRPWIASDKKVKKVRQPEVLSPSQGLLSPLVFFIWFPLDQYTILCFGVQSFMITEKRV